MPNVCVSPVHFHSYWTKNLKLMWLVYSTGSGKAKAILVDDCTTLCHHMAARHKVIFILILFGCSNNVYRHYISIGARSTILIQCFLKIQNHAALPSLKAFAKPM